MASNWYNVTDGLSMPGFGLQCNPHIRFLLPPTRPGHRKCWAFLSQDYFSYHASSGTSFICLLSTSFCWLNLLGQHFFQAAFHLTFWHTMHVTVFSTWRFLGQRLCWWSMLLTHSMHSKATCRCANHLDIAKCPPGRQNQFLRSPALESCGRRDYLLP